MWRIVVGVGLLAGIAAAGEVRFVAKGEGYQLLRDGKPYAIRGAGGTRALERLVEAGGNSVRTWSPPGRATMDDAQRLGLSVMLGLPLGLPRQGFSYDSAAAVAKQRERVRSLVREYRDHPALLIYALGNEVEHHATDAQRMQVWREIEALARIVKEEDPRHPVITVTAGWGKAVLRELREAAPTLDAVGINTYGGMMRVAEAVREQGWTKPWMVTEFGPRGHWEVSKNPWGLPVEDPSSIKADFYLNAYRKVESSSPAFMGAYVFLWGQKQEKTHTWYGMFLPDGTPLDTVDAMTMAWTGRWPQKRAPRIERLEVVSVLKPGEAWLRVPPGARLRARVHAVSHDGAPLVFSWDLRPDVSDNPSTGGDREPSVEPIAGAVAESGDTCEVTLPAAPGNYRLFVYVRNAHGKAATANRALRVE
jgi:hypothetical protein